MKNDFKIALFALAFALVGLLIAGVIILFLKYFPLGEKRNLDLFLIILSIVSIYGGTRYILKRMNKL